ncbi:signal peptidase II [Desulforamulus ruminis]|uniref:Lipoprotein signal peptidase n=1 Tax=Desulforamulus ruminis (strain ATCC 23193 / DSM 2154 / NCIMB 8452 / DL) TaxID=696281 RepID=F6DMB0_DESRL|nr:signal peptidase II [Desulforamulus ruminis]AEG60577.1 lipoprotein signal peptidase [Desulforamulus ruminis DSM 2154]
MIRFILVMLFTLALDRYSKFIIMNKMTEGQSIPVWNKVFHLTYIQNPGAAFGLLAGKTWFFIMITTLVLLAMVLGWRWIQKAGPLYHWALGLVAGGALGNLIDRLLYTRVIDFLDFRIWPVFNLADTAICIGVGLILLDAFKDLRRVR